MTTGNSGLGLMYPDRAEGVGGYEDYKVFVDFWQPLTVQLAKQFRALRSRRQTKVLGIYGGQGSGKTLFSTQLLEDHKSLKDDQTLTPSSENLWKHMATGAGLSAEAIKVATEGTISGKVPNSPKWVDDVTTWRGTQSRNSIIAVADNTETPYFLRGLVGDEYPYATRTDDAYLEAAASNLVQHARREDAPGVPGLTGMLLIMLSNDRDFLDSFKQKMDAQHEGMMEVMNLPLPNAVQKERAVRVNVNRLNDVSYWHCLDKGGDDQRKVVRERLVDATTFPGTFSAVDEALRIGNERRGVGRPGRKNLLTLVCLSPSAPIKPADYKLTSTYTVEAEYKWAGSYSYDSDWGSKCGLTKREAGLLESEWQLRIVALGQPFVAALLAADPKDATSTAWSANAFKLTKQMLTIIQKPLGRTSRNEARDKYAADIEGLVDGWLVDVTPAQSMLDDFWGRNQSRSEVYEKKLTTLLHNYNRSAEGYLNARPDFVVQNFVPATLTKTKSDEPRALTNAIQRKAHAIEFTSQKTVTPASIGKYLESKVRNYLLATQEQ